jgi:tRNA-dependent cyclodipeptide synthase
MRIENYLNTTKEEVENKKHNIWIGVSLGNGYFNQENIKQYILWSLEYTKESVLVLIADHIQSINIEVLDGKTPEGAERRALKLGERKYQEILTVINSLPEDKRKLVDLVRWNDLVEKDEHYQNALQLVREEFKTNQIFHDHIIRTVVEGRKDRESRITKLDESQLDKLAEYVLQELPYLAGGVMGREGVHYTLFPYPGLNELDELAIGLNNQTVYPELAKKLNINNKIAEVEAYVE